MVDPYFRRLSGDDADGRYEAGKLTVGPWSDTAQHGGPPNALAVLLADRVVRGSTGRADLHPLRIASDFVGVVPVGEFDASVTIVRAARSAALCAVQLSAGGRVCLASRVWFVRAGATAEVASSVEQVEPPPAGVGGRAEEQRSGWDFGYGRSVAWHFTAGGPPRLGPASVWALARHPVLDEPATGLAGLPELPGLARVVLVADSASGVSAELDWADWSFANVDLDVHLVRPFAGEWVHLAAATTIGPSGAALARSTIADTAGVVGSGLQTLVVAEIPREADSGG